VAGLAAAVLVAVPAQGAVTAAKLRRALASDPVGAATSVLVADAAGRVVYARGASRRLLPASNEKLLTEVAALDVLGPDFRFATEAVAADLPDASGVVAGDIAIVGAGDPRLRRADLGVLARRVRAAGVREVTGGVVADGTLFDGKRGGPGWAASDLGEECAPLSAIPLDGNRFRGVAQAKPELRAARLFRRALARAGVRVAGGFRVGRRPPSTVVVGVVASPPLHRILPAMGKDSDNFTAETILKDIAAYSGHPGTTWFGARGVRAALQRRGIDLRGTRTGDGSGLSRFDRVTTRVLVRVLQSADRDPRIGLVLRASLAIAGVDGTLVHRMQSGPAHGYVIAKTGSLHDASALSGFAGGYTFSVVANQEPRIDILGAHRVQDRIAQLLARG
jgi:D-alanyl-D-alanine carboxypeptidase/D-alanyl-D-alanine-endopeptidase (penicillin-binding protein 4)